MSAKTLRCAIYTRKSSEEGLDQDFNSLHAQREACEAYIKSQRHEGWKLIPDAYDDGGISGGTMQRPALLKLLEDIKAKRVDIIVVYKVDRLTRSLADFARMVELFDENQVSFVSVTQQFNTTSSMGRLTLNVLLSFAQFEREVTGERIRDKIKASKAKGMFMGGGVPLGYETKDRRLQIIPNEADTVRTIFNLYIELRCVRLLRQKLKTMQFTGRIFVDWNEGALYALLNNPIYIGKIRHKALVHDGQHEPIISMETWNTVLGIKSSNRQGKIDKRKTIDRVGHLVGKLFDHLNEPLVLSHAKKAQRRYHYYISKALKTCEAKEGWRLSVKDTDQRVADMCRTLLSDTSLILNACRAQKMSPHDIAQLIPRTMEIAQTKDHRLWLSDIVHKVTIGQSDITLKIDLSKQVESMKEQALIIEQVIPFSLKRRAQGRRMVFKPSQDDTSHHDETLINNLAKAHHWFDQLINGEVESIKDIAIANKVSREYVGDMINLAFLSPKLTEAILHGRQHEDVNTTSLTKPSAIPLSWVGQEASYLEESLEPGVSAQSRQYQLSQ